MLFVPAGIMTLLVPVLMAVLCGATFLQQPHVSLRLLLLGSLCAAAALAMARFGSWVTPAVAFGLLASGLCWQACAGLFGQRPHPGWLAAAPLVWLTVRAMPWAPVGIGSVVVALVLDHALTLCCLFALVRAPCQEIGQRGLIAATILHALVTGLFLLSVLIPLSGWLATMTLFLAVETLARTVLWPGFGLIAVLEMAGLHDELGGVLNRRGFWRAAEQLGQRTVLLFDIDHFKRINDTLGHAAGDEVIRRFSALASRALGEDTVFGRIGGEEFAAALAGVSPVQARQVAERVRLACAEGGGDVTVSVGISPPSRPGTAAGGRIALGDQMALADHALYRAKRLGRNRTVMHVDDHANTLGRQGGQARRRGGTAENT